MSTRLPGAVAFALLVLIAGPAAAQTAPEADAPAPSAKGKAARAPKPAQAVIVTNARNGTATEVVITGDDEKTTKVAKKIPPKGKLTVKLPKQAGCLVQVAATFEGEGEVEFGELDICKEKTIRFTD
jgi:hypothetical protein